MKNILILLFTFCFIKGNSQVQYIVGTDGEELATHIKRLDADGNFVIAGYSYTKDPQDVSTNLDILLLKMSIYGNIVWQKRISSDGIDDIVYDMIVTQNGDIVIVGSMGRTGVFANNTAFIMRFDPTTGGLIWDRYFYYDPTHPNEVFFAVTETENTDLAAVGASTFAPGSPNGLICIYDNSGTLLQHRSVSSGGSTFYGVTRDITSGTNIYISGHGTGIVDGDGIVLAYDVPGQSIPWFNAYDFVQDTVRQNNFFDDIFLDQENQVLVVSTSSIQGFQNPKNSHGILTLSIAGNSEAFYDIENTVPPTPLAPNVGANNTTIDIVNGDEIYAVQNPDWNSQDAIIWGIGDTRPGVITRITSLTGLGIGNKQTFDSPSSIFDISYYGEDQWLYTTGCSYASNLNIAQNNMFVYLTLPDLSAGCVFEPDVDILSIPFDVWYPTPDLLEPDFSVDFNRTIEDADLTAHFYCGDIPGSPSFKISGKMESRFSVNVYPNPGTDVINVAFDLPENVQTGRIIIQSLEGKILFKQEVSSLEGTKQIDLKNYTTGMYILELEANGQRQRQSFTKM